MNLLPFGQLPPHTPRRFVPANANFNDWSQIGALFDQLETRLSAAAGVADLEAWQIGRAHV